MLQRSVLDSFRGRVFAAELALVTLTMAASNYATGELLDRFNISPRIVTIGVGILFMMPGLTWFLTQRWWDREEKYEDKDRSYGVGGARELATGDGEYSGRES
jgi:small neutral amino acid transporter SnatA (MarC family)